MLKVLIVEAGDVYKVRTKASNPDLFYRAADSLKLFIFSPHRKYDGREKWWLVEAAAFDELEAWLRYLRREMGAEVEWMGTGWEKEPWPRGRPQSMTLEEAYRTLHLLPTAPPAERAARLERNAQSRRAQPGRRLQPRLQSLWGAQSADYRRNGLLAGAAGRRRAAHPQLHSPPTSAARFQSARPADVARVDPADYPEAQQKTAFYEQVRERVALLPGVQAAAFTFQLPLNSFLLAPYLVEGQSQVNYAERPLAALISVSPDYFETLQIPLRQGRFFTARDNEQAPLVAIINEQMARRFWPRDNPIGKRVVVGRQTNLCEIVGVVGDVRSLGLTAESREQVFLPYAQRQWARLNLVVRTAGDPLNLTAAVRREVLAVDKGQPITDVQTMEQNIAGWVAQPRLTMWLFGIFAGAALLLAAIGLYGVMAYSVTQRTGEIGIRLALGAQTSDVLKLVVWQGMRLALLGVACGVLASLALTHLMANLLFGVSAHDPATFAWLALLLAGVALLACYLPARKATKVDPMIALRYE